jgi:hypothetical protein
MKEFKKLKETSVPESSGIPDRLCSRHERENTGSGAEKQ